MPWKSKGPLSLSGATAAPVTCLSPSLRFRVVPPVDAALPNGAAGVALDEPLLADWDWASGAPLLELSGGGDVCLRARRCAGVPSGCIALDEPQRFNVHAVLNEVYAFDVLAAEPPPLAEVELELRLLGNTRASSPLLLDTAGLAADFIAANVGRVLAVGEVLLVPLRSGAAAPLRARVAAADRLDAAAREEAVAYHSFRGVVSPSTEVRFSAEQSSGVALTNAPPTARPPSANRVAVRCSDGEVFDVHKDVLRPCIALTKVLRRAGPNGGSEASVDVDCLVFDRVLLFLESIATGAPRPSFGVNLLDDLASASRTLGLRALEEYCSERLGEFSGRLREYSFSEVVRRNAGGECILIVDGMVLDVTRWLPEHPGGSTRQSLNLDAARFFELYHHSRESFLYLKSFYIGEISTEDRPLVPQPAEPPSADFLTQLREYSAFRLAVKGPHKSF